MRPKRSNWKASTPKTEELQTGTKNEFTEFERIMAARIRVTVDKKFGRKTEPWILELANQTPKPSTTRSFTLEEKASAARIQMTSDRKNGRKSEPWIVELAKYRG